MKIQKLLVDSQMFQSSPVTITFHDRYYSHILIQIKIQDHILEQLDAVLATFQQKSIEGFGIVSVGMDDPLIHEMVAVLNAILNYGIDQSNYNNSSFNTPQPIVSSESKNNSYRIFYQIYANEFPFRKSVRFVNSLDFIRGIKQKAQIWTLLEIADLKVTEIFEFAKSPEISFNYCQNSIIKQYFEQVKNRLNEIDGVTLNIEGELLDKYKEYYEFDEFDAVIEPVSCKIPTGQMARISIIQSIRQIDISPKGLTLKLIILVEIQKYQNSPKFMKDDISQFSPLKDTLLNDRENIKGVVQINNLRVKNSEVLFQNDFAKYFQYPLQQQFSKQTTFNKLSNQHNQCHNCQNSINQGLFPFKQSSAYICNFSGKWFCKSCMSSVPILIPQKVVKKLDMNSYAVSSLAYRQITENMKTPLLVLEYFEDIVFKNSQLHNFLVWKRQIHLIYDSYCNTEKLEKLAERLEIFNNKQMFLTINLFSLDNLKNIIEGNLVKQLKLLYLNATQHMFKCDQCSLAAEICQRCKSQNKIFAHDILNVQYCRNCRTLYHRICFQKDNCIKCMSTQINGINI